MLTISGLSMLWQAAPPEPSKEFDLGIWYALVVIAVIALVVSAIVSAVQGDYCAQLYLTRKGDIRWIGATDQVFTNPRIKQTEDYITGRFG